MDAMPSRDDTFPCPNCGADVRADALACPECGSDEKTGWSPETESDGLDLPDPDEPVDYSRLGLEGESPAARAPSVLGIVALIVAMLMILLFVFLNRGVPH